MIYVPNPLPPGRTPDVTGSFRVLSHVPGTTGVSGRGSAGVRSGREVRRRLDESPAGAPGHTEETDRGGPESGVRPATAGISVPFGTVGVRVPQVLSGDPGSRHPSREDLTCPRWLTVVVGVRTDGPSKRFPGWGEENLDD